MDSHKTSFAKQNRQDRWQPKKRGARVVISGKLSGFLSPFGEQFYPLAQAGIFISKVLDKVD